MIRFRNTVLIYEMSFDPTLYPDDRAFQFKKTNNTMFINLIDSTSGIVKAMRAANLPLKFIQICTDSWARVFLEHNYSEKYAMWYKSLTVNSLEQLWQRAEYVGKMGEDYNLTEVNYHHNSQFYTKK